MFFLKDARLRAGIFLFILIPGISGCCLLPRQPDAFPKSFTPASYLIDTVPFYSQQADQCGPASLAMVLQWTGVEATPETLAPEVYTPVKKGTLQPLLISAARSYDRLAYPLKGIEPLLQELAAGHPVIILQNLGLSWFPKWHYAVAIGYDLQTGEILLHSGLQPKRPMSWTLFRRTWQRAQYWGLVVLPPGQMPASAEEQSYLTAVLGLEQSRPRPSVVQAYAAAVERWPTSLGALIGLGNACYALNDLGRAEEAFRTTVHAHPDNGAACNNLAYVLAEEGKCREALEMAEQAIALGGPQVSIFQRTKESILNRMQTGSTLLCK
jgi:hypothetical protein